MSALSRYLLDFVEKRPREEIGVTPLMLLGFVLFCLLITVVAFFLLGDRAHSPAPGRKPR